MIGEEINKNSLKSYLESYLENVDLDIFVLFSLSFYVNNSVNNEVDKKTFVILINEIVEKKVSIFTCSSYFSNISISDINKRCDGALRSNQYYFLNAFYHFPLITAKNKESIGKLIFNLNYKPEDPIMVLMKGFKGSFINWDQKLNDSLKVLLSNKKLSTQESGI